MLIEYIHGTTASELRQHLKCPPGSFGTPAQDAKFRKQMAKIHAEILSFKFDKIGSLYYSEKSDAFYIGPEANMGLGPWKSSREFYADLSDHLLRKMLTVGSPMAKESPSFVLPLVLARLMRIYGEEADGPFRLVNGDFGPHNILVDGEFNIVGVVDFDAVMAAPLEAAAQYPVFSSMDLDPPGVPITKQAVLERIERTRPLMERYKANLSSYEAGNEHGLSPVGSRLMSTSSHIWVAFQRYEHLLKGENEIWFASALNMLREHAEDK